MDLRLFLDCATLVLIFSALMDLYLWFSVGYMVPSWTLAGMMLVVALLCQVIKRLMAWTLEGVMLVVALLCQVIKRLMAAQ